MSDGHDAVTTLPAVTDTKTVMPPVRAHWPGCSPTTGNTNSGLRIGSIADTLRYVHCGLFYISGYFLSPVTENRSAASRGADDRHDLVSIVAYRRTDTVYALLVLLIVNTEAAAPGGEDFPHFADIDHLVVLKRGEEIVVFVPFRHRRSSACSFRDSTDHVTIGARYNRSRAKECSR